MWQVCGHGKYHLHSISLPYHFHVMPMFNPTSIIHIQPTREGCTELLGRLLKLDEVGTVQVPRRPQTINANSFFFLHQFPKTSTQLSVDEAELMRGAE